MNKNPLTGANKAVLVTLTLMLSWSMFASQSNATTLTSIIDTQYTVNRSINQLDTFLNPLGYSLVTESTLEVLLKNDNFIVNGDWNPSSSRQTSVISYTATHYNGGTGNFAYEKGNWSLFERHDGSLGMIDMLYNNGCYLLSVFDASIKGITRSSTDPAISSLYIRDSDQVSPPPPNSVPVPGAVWLFGSAIIGLVARRKLSKS